MAYKITHEQFVKDVQDKFGDVYNILEKYQGVNTKILVEHRCEDGNYYQWRISPSNLLHGKGLCPKCSGRDTGIEAFKRKVLNKYGDEYIVLGEYKNRSTKILLKHNTSSCHNEFLQTPHNLLYFNTGCPLCSPISKGENYIENNLQKNLIPYKKQYTFKDCKFKEVLRFDFAIFEDKEETKIKYLIEYQGNQHYKPQTFNGISKEKAEHVFEESIIKDQIKRDYCIKNNIQLLEIAYWNFDNINEILNNIS